MSPHDFLHTLVPFLQHNHCTYHHSNIPSESRRNSIHTALIIITIIMMYNSVCVFAVSFGPYLPCRENIKLMGGKNNIRPPRPELNMCLLPSMVETSKVCTRPTHDSCRTLSFRYSSSAFCVSCRVRMRCMTGCCWTTSCRIISSFTCSVESPSTVRSSQRLW